MWCLNKKNLVFVVKLAAYFYYSSVFDDFGGFRRLAKLYGVNAWMKIKNKRDIMKFGVFFFLH